MAMPSGRTALLFADAGPATDTRLAGRARMSFERSPAMMEAYFVAISALLFCGVSALTLIYTVKHFDPPEVGSSAEDAHRHVTV
jgi:hypothetical protein